MSDTKTYVKELCGAYVEDWVSTQLADELDDKDNRIEELERKLDEGWDKYCSKNRLLVDELKADNKRLREVMGTLYDLWIEDADPNECYEIHEQVRKVLEVSRDRN